MSENIDLKTGFSFPLKHWGFEKVPPDDGPRMTSEGVTVKLLLLLVLFTAGFLFSWHHFLVHHLQDTPLQKAHTTLVEVPAWQGSMWIYRAIHYPLYSLLLFLVSFCSCFLIQKGLAIMVPVCVTLQGVSCGAFEFVLHDSYPGVTLLCGLIAVGMFAGLLVIYWIGLADSDNPFALGLAGAVGGLVFAGIAVSVIRAFDDTNPFLHQPLTSGSYALALIVLGSVILVDTFAQIDHAIKAGAPRWLEWRAAACLFACYLGLLKYIRELLLNKTARELIWDSVNASMKSGAKSDF